MPFNYEDVLYLIQQLSEQKNIKVTIKESLKGASMVAGGAFAGSLFGGPIGLVIGSLLGTTVAYNRGKGKYYSIPYIIQNEMTYAEREALVESVNKVVSNIDAGDAVMLLKLVMSNSSLEALVLQEITGFFAQKGYSIMTA